MWPDRWFMGAELCVYWWLSRQVRMSLSLTISVYTVSWLRLVWKDMFMWDDWRVNAVQWPNLWAVHQRFDLVLQSTQAWDHLQWGSYQHPSFGPCGMVFMHQHTCLTPLVSLFHLHQVHCDQEDNQTSLQLWTGNGTVMCQHCQKHGGGGGGD